MEENIESRISGDNSIEAIAASINAYVGVDGAVTPDELRSLALDQEPEHQESLVVVTADQIEAMDMGKPTPFEISESLYTGVAFAGTYRASRGRLPRSVPSDSDLWEAADLTNHQGYNQ